MAEDTGRYYITTPIYYVNDRPHIGHAYTSLACDLLARFMRLDGRKVLFLTGTDEHGQKVAQSARERGLEPQAYADQVSAAFRTLTEVMGFSIDTFIRTTEERHKAAVQALWRVLRERDQIYLGQYAGWYSVSDEAFYGEDELTERGGKRFAPTGKQVEWVEEPSYFFRLSAWQDRLLALYGNDPDFILPKSRRNEITAFVKGGLRDLSISRTTYSWGIPVPDDPAHVTYVWFDALINYITAAGYPGESGQAWQTFWPADLHMVGKDILRFHTVYWPAFLMAADLAPPKRVFAHGWWTNEGQKISKSLGNVIDPFQLIEYYGLDQVRYFLMREVPFGQDGDFSHTAMVRRVNDDLANDLGNLAQRLLSMIAKNCGGQVPEHGAFTEEDKVLLDGAGALLGSLRSNFERQAFHRGLESIWQVVGDANRYADAQAPWALRKSDPSRMATVLYVLAECLRRVGLAIQPVMPTSAGKLLDQLAVAEGERSFAHFDEPLDVGRPLPKPQALFPRLPEEAERC
ncbi:MAG: methionine--tRNA ligase [Rhodospirillales bacterium]|nr:methionine--tRNA ligase [Rhodospirillales bacterium]